MSEATVAGHDPDELRQIQRRRLMRGWPTISLGDHGEKLAVHECPDCGAVYHCVGANEHKHRGYCPTNVRRTGRRCARC